MQNARLVQGIAPVFRKMFGCAQPTSLAKRTITTATAIAPPPPSVLRPIGSNRKVALSAGEAGTLNWPAPQAVRATSPLSETIQAWVLDFETGNPFEIIDVQRDVFASQIRTDIMHRAVTYERNMKRQGTHSSRNRSQVRGSTRKIQPQKGLGKARHGSNRAPQFVGGGKAHGPVPRSHATELQRKVWLMALRSVLSVKYAQDQLAIVDNMAIKSHKSGDLMRYLKTNGWAPLGTTKRAASVMLLPFMDPNPEAESADELVDLELASRNVRGVSLMAANNAEVYEILRHDYLILDRKALDLLQSILKPM
ncbi:54S ribosomal protein yml6, mitochondrial [Coemansia sp. RSA 1200]|nr:54S ribosomal protein yml6, mitochondrial [Coemansia sp. RSA 1200]